MSNQETEKEKTLITHQDQLKGRKASPPEKDFVIDYHPSIPKYDGLNDKYLKHFFDLSFRKKHLKKMGLLKKKRIEDSINNISSDISNRKTRQNSQQDHILQLNQRIRRSMNKQTNQFERESANSGSNKMYLNNSFNYNESSNKELFRHNLSYSNSPEPNSVKTTLNFNSQNTLDYHQSIQNYQRSISSQDPQRSMNQIHLHEVQEGDAQLNTSQMNEEDFPIERILSLQKKQKMTSKRQQIIKLVEEYLNEERIRLHREQYKVNLSKGLQNRYHVAVPSENEKYLSSLQNSQNSQAFGQPGDGDRAYITPNNFRHRNNNGFTSPNNPYSINGPSSNTRNHIKLNELPNINRKANDSRSPNYGKSVQQGGATVGGMTADDINGISQIDQSIGMSSIYNNAGYNGVGQTTPAFQQSNNDSFIKKKNLYNISKTDLNEADKLKEQNDSNNGETPRKGTPNSNNNIEVKPENENLENGSKQVSQQSYEKNPPLLPPAQIDPFDKINLIYTNNQATNTRLKNGYRNSSSNPVSRQKNIDIRDKAKTNQNSLIEKTPEKSKPSPLPLPPSHNNNNNSIGNKPSHNYITQNKSMHQQPGYSHRGNGNNLQGGLNSSNTTGGMVSVQNKLKSEPGVQLETNQSVELEQKYHQSLEKKNTGNYSTNNSNNNNHNSSNNSSNNTSNNNTLNNFVNSVESKQQENNNKSIEISKELIKISPSQQITPRASELSFKDDKSKEIKHNQSSQEINISSDNIHSSSQQSSKKSQKKLVVGGGADETKTNKSNFLNTDSYQTVQRNGNPLNSHNNSSLQAQQLGQQNQQGSTESTQIKAQESNPFQQEDIDDSDDGRQTEQQSRGASVYNYNAKNFEEEIKDIREESFYIHRESEYLQENLQQDSFYKTEKSSFRDMNANKGIGGATDSNQNQAQSIANNKENSNISIKQVISQKKDEDEVEDEEIYNDKFQSESDGIEEDIKSKLSN